VLAAIAAAAFAFGSDVAAGPAPGSLTPTIAPGAEADTVKVPNVRGESLDAAREILAAVDLGANPVPPDADGDWIVVRQSPAAGQPAPRGDEVEVFVEPPADDRGTPVESDEPSGPDDQGAGGALDGAADAGGLLGILGAIVLAVVGFVALRSLVGGQDPPPRDDRPRLPAIRAVGHPDRSPTIGSRDLPR
jgi:hypothetical protein